MLLGSARATNGAAGSVKVTQCRVRMITVVAGANRRVQLRSGERAEERGERLRASNLQWISRRCEPSPLA